MEETTPNFTIPSLTDNQTLMLSKIDSLVESLKKDFGISNDDATLIDGEMSLFIFEDVSDEDCIQSVQQNIILTLPKEKIDPVISKIKFFIQEVKTRIPSLAATPKQATAEISTVEPLKKPEPITSLTPSSFLADHLTNPVVVAPTVRDHSLDRAVSEHASMPMPQAPTAQGIPQAPQPAPKGISSIDPYRELPEK